MRDRFRGLVDEGEKSGKTLREYERPPRQSRCPRPARWRVYTHALEAEEGGLAFADFGQAGTPWGSHRTLAFNRTPSAFSTVPSIGADRLV